MSGKRIEFEDIRVGDKIRIIDTNEVEVKEIDLIGAGYLNNMHPKVMLNWGRSFELIERLLPKIPDTVGSVIEVKGARYVLVHNDYQPTDTWVNVKTGYSHAPERMQVMAGDAAGFEVIAL